MTDNNPIEPPAEPIKPIAASEPSYGSPQPQYGQYGGQPTNSGPQLPFSGFAIAGLAIGIFTFFILPILAILGIVFSSIALRQTNPVNATHRGRGLAVSGLIISIIALVGGLIYNALRAQGVM
jgi:hypothetical protein